jgi:hypothetical protein
MPEAAATASAAAAAAPAQVDDLGVPLQAQYSEARQRLTLTHCQARAGAAADGGAAGNDSSQGGRGRDRGNSGGGGGGGGGLTSAAGLSMQVGLGMQGSPSSLPLLLEEVAHRYGACLPCTRGSALPAHCPAQAVLDKELWMEGLSRARNSGRLTPARLPLELGLLQRVPLVVGAFVDKRSGHLTDVCARLYVEGLPLREGAQDPAQAAVLASPLQYDGLQD